MNTQKSLDNTYLQNNVNNASRIVVLTDIGAAEESEYQLETSEQTHKGSCLPSAWKPPTVTKNLNTVWQK